MLDFFFLQDSSIGAVGNMHPFKYYETKKVTYLTTSKNFYMTLLLELLAWRISLRIIFMKFVKIFHDILYAQGVTRSLLENWISQNLNISNINKKLRLYVCKLLYRVSHQYVDNFKLNIENWKITCQKVSPVLKFLWKKLSDDILKLSKIKLEVFLNWREKKGPIGKMVLHPATLLKFYPIDHNPRELKIKE